MDKTMTKNRSSRKLSEQDRELLENLGKFCIRAKHSTWETVNHTNENEAAVLFREVGTQLTPTEYRGLTDGWSEYRLSGSDEMLNEVVDSITHRIQDHVESF
jgi:hypothetical protein